VENVGKEHFGVRHIINPAQWSGHEKYSTRYLISHTTYEYTCQAGVIGDLYMV